MNSQMLFIELVQRLGRYSDAALLWVLLKEQADVAEYKSSAEHIASEQLQGTVKRWDVQRSLERLEQQGLIAVRVHANHRTHFSVHRDAVLALLRSPATDRLPSRSTRNFSFLDAWKNDVADTERELTVREAVEAQAVAQPSAA